MQYSIKKGYKRVLESLMICYSAHIFRLFSWLSA